MGGGCAGECHCDTYGIAVSQCRARVAPHVGQFGCRPHTTFDSSSCSPEWEACEAVTEVPTSGPAESLRRACVVRSWSYEGDVLELEARAAVATMRRAAISH